MITYNYIKPFNEISNEDTNFVIVFSDGVQEHFDSVQIPRDIDLNIDIDQLNQNIDQLVQHVTTKFSSGFF